MQKPQPLLRRPGMPVMQPWRSIRVASSQAPSVRAGSPTRLKSGGFGQRDTFEPRTGADDPFRGLRDHELVRAIRGAALSKKRKLDYREVRRLIFGVIDQVEGKVECVYTGRVRPAGAPPAPDDMNLEHIWPQSRGAKGAAKVDMHNLAVADSEANRKRGNVPFGEVVTPLWAKGGSVLGTDRDGELVFTPRAAVRGNIARAIFYFAAVYGFAIDAKEEAVLRRWEKADPADAAELARTRKIEREQGNANAFVLYPALIDRARFRPG